MKSNIEDFVTYEQAKLLNELGFNYETTHGYYKIPNESAHLADIRRCEVEVWEHSAEFYQAPFLAQAQKWLREKGIYLFVTMEESHYYWYIGKEFQIGNCDTYEQSLSLGVDKALQLLNEENK